ncbi:peptide deformylase [Dysgonomonas sp. ZJ279]|uniref:peptide deformylase n=1 Tax=Dysgonomonas sp. ZJ279 TaxID=2709796 RepID=UPI0013E9F383|nr:peptide deformylase [Dysgonomonas sp. ZJ279]
MTKVEKDLINSADSNTPFKVLQTDNTEDSLFLRKKSIDIDNVKDIASDKDLQLFIDRLKLTMKLEEGVGIAAPQVGLGRNIFLFLRIDKPDYPVQVAINPRITNQSTETICFERDGCLSVPNISGTTKRHAWVEVEYYDEKGILTKERLMGTSREGDFTGVIFQHEYDHLQGILFIDRLCQQPAE